MNLSATCKQAQLDTKHKKWPCSECVALVVITTLQIIQQRAAELHTQNRAQILHQCLSDSGDSCTAQED